MTNTPSSREPLQDLLETSHFVCVDEILFHELSGLKYHQARSEDRA
jgi:hypothetical protein